MRHPDAGSIPDGNLDPEYVIVGIGINLYMPTEGFGKELENIAGSVLQEQSGDIKNKILAETLNRYFYYYKTLRRRNSSRNTRSAVWF